jgi:hypothetical protein
MRTPCAIGVCSICTLEVETFEERSKILTVDVQNAAWFICHALGKVQPAARRKAPWHPAVLG